MIGDKKSIYQSTLARFGEAYVTIKSDVMESKKKRGTYYLVLEHDGDEQFLNLENDRCASALRGKKGQSLTIKATGSREDADIQILNPDGTVKRPEASVARPNASGVSGRPNARKTASQWSQAATLALETVHALKFAHDAEYNDTHMKPEQFQALVSGLIIYFDRRGVIETFEVSEKLEEKPAAPETHEEDIPW